MAFVFQSASPPFLSTRPFKQRVWSGGRMHARCAMNKNGIGDTLWKNPITGLFFWRAVKALVRVTLSDSFRIRPRTEV